MVGWKAIFSCIVEGVVLYFFLRLQICVLLLSSSRDVFYFCSLAEIRDVLYLCPPPEMCFISFHLQRCVVFLSTCRGVLYFCPHAVVCCISVHLQRCVVFLSICRGVSANPHSVSPGLVCVWLPATPYYSIAREEHTPRQLTYMEHTNMENTHMEITT